MTQDVTSAALTGLRGGGGRFLNPRLTPWAEICRAYSPKTTLLNHHLQVQIFLNMIPSNFQLLRGTYCKKRIFQVQKTSETKQMLIRFFNLKKGLFPLF